MNLDYSTKELKSDIHNLDYSVKEKEMRSSEYKRGFEDGKESADKRCYESGFRDGVQFGVEAGYYNGYIQIIRRFIERNYSEEEKDNQEKIVHRMKTLLDKYEKVILESKDIEELKKIYKILTSSLKSLSKKTSLDKSSLDKTDQFEF